MSFSFNQPAGGSAFGSSGFGGGGGLFGASTPQASTGLQQASGLGFGAAPTTQGGFGAAPTAQGGFGAAPAAQGGFGAAPAAQGGFGAAPAAQGGFGAAPGAAGFGAPVVAPAGQFGAVNNDFEIPRDANYPTDSISCIAFGPQDYPLLVSSWDGGVRLYNVQDQQGRLSSELRMFIKEPTPVFDACWRHDQTACFFGGASNAVRMWNFNQQNAMDVGRHDAPVKSVRWIPNNNMLVSGGWDNCIKYWDLRSPNAVATVQLPGRVDCMDVKFPYCVVGTGGTEDQRQILIYNLNMPHQPERVLNQNSQQTAPNANANNQKPLKKQYRSVSIFPDATGFAVASIEGRCSIQYFSMDRLSNNFAFRCHRDKNTKRIYPVNSLVFHPTFGTFATAGSDGMFYFWDKDSKQRLKFINPIKLNNDMPAAIVSSSFSANGLLYAYATSYEWSKGAAFNPGAAANGIMIHRVVENEIKPRRA